MSMISFTDGTRVFQSIGDVRCANKPMNSSGSLIGRPTGSNEEMVITAKIGESLGDQQQAAELFARLKAELAKHTGNLTEDELRQIVINVSTQMGLELTDQEIDSVVSILIKIQGLDINWDQALQQISSFKNQVEAFLSDNPEAKSLLEDLVTFVMDMLEKVLAWLGASSKA